MRSSLVDACAQNRWLYLLSAKEHPRSRSASRCRGRGGKQDSPGAWRYHNDPVVLCDHMLPLVFHDADHALLDLEVFGLQPVYVPFSQIRRSISLKKITETKNRISRNRKSRYLQWWAGEPVPNDPIISVVCLSDDPATIIFLEELEQRGIVCSKDARLRGGQGATQGAW
jgi:hypothetical protein